MKKAIDILMKRNDERRKKLFRSFFSYDTSKSTFIYVRWRLFIFLFALTFMATGPVYRQIIGNSNPYLRPWIMFHGWGHKICDVQFSVSTEDGKKRAIDPYLFLDSSNWWKAPKRLKNLKKPSEVLAQANTICKRLPKGKLLYSKVRCGKRGGGWKVHSDGSKPLCIGEKASQSSKSEARQ